MSFITKRERVFNEYDLFDLPARNEGKLKAYASCTDARAWSHFCSDKSEHLVEIIKRNNETIRPKYLPTNVIVETLMVAKNAEIARLKQKIEEFEEMLAAYDQLELSCAQKCEIADAHAAIRAANKELDDMCLDLDLSGFTEALESETFQTGKSRGDGDEIIPLMYDQEEQATPMTEAKSAQYTMSCTCDIGTLATDPRLDELQDVIISKDAKLNAMKNTIAVMENDVCEPYCIYAHIYTALEKICGILCQNDKYRQYLNLLTAGKDTRCIDIKGKILFKLKVLEKFCVALIAPCNKDFTSEPSGYDCECYRTEVTTRIETNYAITASELSQPNIDNKRAHLVADIIQNEEMKEILIKESFSVNQEKDVLDDVYILHDYNIDTENLERLKKLQENYDDLMTCYESLKHEKECFVIRCHKYEELEKEFENLKLKIKEYNSLWNEKEHYRKRSADLDTLKEQYLILTDETANLETQVKAESEINYIKSKTIEELRNENIRLEKKINEALISFEKEKSTLLCKLKEADCRMMCQAQQIKSLTIQIDRLLEHDHKILNPQETENTSIALIDEVESNRDQIKNLKDALFCNEEEKQSLQQQYQDQLKLITELRSNLEDYKSAYEKSLQRNDYLEKYTESLLKETKALSIDVQEKSRAVDNLKNIVDNKSQEINNLLSESEKSQSKNRQLSKQICELRNEYNISVASLEREKMQVLKNLQLAREESEELLEKVKDYDDVINSNSDVPKSSEINRECETKTSKSRLTIKESNNSMLLQEVQRLRDLNKIVVSNVNSLEDANKQYKTCLEVTQKESGQLKVKLSEYENLTLKMKYLQISYEKLFEDKKILENQLLEKGMELEKAMLSIQINKRESNELMGKLNESQSVKEELLRLSDAYQKLAIEKHAAETDLQEVKSQMENLLQSLNNMKLHNEHLLQQCRQLDAVEQELQDTRKAYNELLYEKNVIVDEFNDKKEREFNNLYDMLEKKIEENRELNAQIISLQENQAVANNSIQALQDDNLRTQDTLNVIKKESAELLDKIKYYKTLEVEFDQLKEAHDKMKIEKEKLQTELNLQLADLQKVEEQNNELHYQSQNLISHSEELEKALINSRTELIKASVSPDTSYKDILKEIETMRRDKLVNQDKIRDLRDKLDESENIISNLSEDVLARNDRIAILENHINELENEVRILHEKLIEVVTNGEEINKFGFQKIDSIKNIEAHHSKATHNMKMEMARLQQQNAVLEEQLSVTKRKSNESSRETNRYVSELVHLCNEREIIVTEIKDLEVTNLGDSALSPSNCDVEDILLSLDRIRKNLDARNSKSALLEQTILKVQTSSQLLLSKADEAKRLVEKEKLKIISEKEDAIKDRLNMEKQMLALKDKMEKQVANDKSVITDLEGTILNQKLIIDKINKSTQDYISKLKEELQNIQNLYRDSIAKISELQKDLQNVTEDRNYQKKMLDSLKINFDAKSQEVFVLQEELENIINKPVNHFGTQTKTANNYHNRETQIEKELLIRDKIQIGYTDIYREDNGEAKLITKSSKTLQCDKSTQFGIQSQTNQSLSSANRELQVLTATVTPTFDYVKYSYKQYKINCLSTGKLEQCSISCTSDNEMNDFYLVNSSPERIQEDSYRDKRTEDTILLDSFNERSIRISDKHNQKKSSSYDGFVTKDIINDTFRIETSDANNLPSHNLANKDLFVIYKDSHASSLNGDQEKDTWSKIIKKGGEKHIEQDRFLNGNDEKHENDKHKLNMKMSRVQKDSTHSLLTISDDAKKSLNSYTSTIYSSPKVISTSDTKIPNNEIVDNIKGSGPSLPALFNENKYMRDENDGVREVLKSKVTNITSNIFNKEAHSMRNETEKKSINFKQSSHHKLLRVGADVLIFKTEEDTKLPDSSDIQQIQDFGLEYILDTVQGEVNLNKIKIFTDIPRPRSSNGILKTSKIDNIKSDSLLRFSELNAISPEYKMQPKIKETGSKRQLKTFNDKSVTAKLETKEDYVKTIHSLTQALENIEKDYKKKIETIKMQYDRNIRSIINDHNQGVKSIQNLHEETLQDMIKMHENEVENLRSMSIEAMRKSERLEKENRALKNKIPDQGLICLDEEPIKMTTHELRKRKKNRGNPKMLTKTIVEAINVKPMPRAHGPCTCTLDINVSDTIRNIFEQVDVEQRKMAEHTYMKYIANKMLNGNIEILDAHELSFLHLKVCRMWKNKQSKEEALQKRINNLETELVNKQRNTQQHIADLDRKVEEERRRLQEVCEAVCRVTPKTSRPVTPSTEISSLPPLPSTTDEQKYLAGCACEGEVGARGSAGDLQPVTNVGIRARCTTTRNEKGAAAKMDTEERRREKKLYNDEPPTRLRRSHDRQQRPKK